MTLGDEARYKWQGHVVELVEHAALDGSEVVVSVVKSGVSDTVGLTFVVPIEQLVSIPRHVAAEDGA